jgi:NAD(P)H-nitrite reductase large subunit
MAVVNEYTYRELGILTWLQLVGTTVFLLFRYDKLIIACGSTTNTHGVPGLEDCFQLKTIRDAQNIRRRIMGKTRLSIAFQHGYVSHTAHR